MSATEQDPTQRRSRYLRMATEATELANADRRVDMRESGLHVAASWLKLASNEDGQAATPSSDTRPSR